MRQTEGPIMNSTATIASSAQAKLATPSPNQGLRDAPPVISRQEGGVIMLNPDDAITIRHSTRMFLPQKPVPRELVVEALALAQCAPSNSNIQPWHIYLASGARRNRLVAALT
jgi:hypothetical protein